MPHDLSLCLDGSFNLSRVKGVGVDCQDISVVMLAGSGSGRLSSLLPGSVELIWAQFPEAFSEPS